MKKRKKSRIPEFKSREEEAHFWDTHDITDYFDEMEDVEIVFDLEKPKDDRLVIRLQKDVKKRLESVAARKGINPSTLGRMWIIEKLTAR